MILLPYSVGPDHSAHAQADLGRRCPHVPPDTFSHGATHMCVNVLYALSYETCQSVSLVRNIPILNRQLLKEHTNYQFEFRI